MKIIYSGLHYTNYNPNFGPSFEHNDFYEALRRMAGVEVVYFPYERILELGREKGNKELLELVKKEKPELFFAFMFTDELDKSVLDEIKKYTTSLAWFSDDQWRFPNYSRHYAPHFSWVVTTYPRAIEEYNRIGVKNVICSQWAASADIYKPVSWSGKDNPPDVSFVGTWSRPRQKVIAALEKAGIKVSVFGKGWPDGRIGQEKMLEIFSNSKINLALNPPPGYLNVNSLGRLFFRRSMDKIIPDFHLINNFRLWLRRGIPQIKARHFEIPACGGFLMTSMADGLDKYFDLNREIVVYKNKADLIDKIKYYLNNDGERIKIAKAGYERTVKEHTYQKRFEEIFRNVKGI